MKNNKLILIPFVLIILFYFNTKIKNDKITNFKAKRQEVYGYMESIKHRPKCNKCKAHHTAFKLTGITQHNPATKCNDCHNHKTDINKCTAPNIVNEMYGEIK